MKPTANEVLKEVATLGRARLRTLVVAFEERYAMSAIGTVANKLVDDGKLRAWQGDEFGNERVDLPVKWYELSDKSKGEVTK